MSEQPKEEVKKPDEEKTKEELIEEVKNLRNELSKLNEELEMTRAECQMRDMKISFWEQTANLENNRIVEYRKTISDMKKK